MTFLHLILAFFFALQGPTLGSTTNGSSGGASTITRVEIVSTNGSCSSGLTGTFGTATTAGELITVAYMAGPTSGSAGTVSDNKGGGSSTYTKAGEITGLGAHATFGTQYTANSASGITTVTIQANSETSCALIISHYKNLAASPLDQNTGNPTSSGNVTPPYNFASATKTTTFANELLAGTVGCKVVTGSTACAMTGSGSWPATMTKTQIVNGANDLVGYNELIVTSTQTGIANTGTATGSGDAIAVAPMMVTFHQ
jgi:hypothetical protein